MKLGDSVVFKKDYKGIVKAGEVHEIDKIIHNGVYIKLDTTWIYLDDTNFNEYCELKPIFCQTIQKKDGIVEKDNVNPNHYKQGRKEVIEMMIDIWGIENTIIFCEMNAFKYRMRVGLKENQPVKQEIDKAIWYEKKAIELKNN